MTKNMSASLSSICRLNALLIYNSAEPVLSSRNFDPQTRTLRKRVEVDAEMEDTVEKDVAGLAERIIAEEEEARAQELVCATSWPAYDLG